MLAIPCIRSQTNKTPMLKKKLQNGYRNTNESCSDEYASSLNVPKDKIRYTNQQFCRNHQTLNLQAQIHCSSAEAHRMQPLIRVCKGRQDVVILFRYGD